MAGGVRSMVGRSMGGGGSSMVAERCLEQIDGWRCQIDGWRCQIDGWQIDGWRWLIDGGSEMRGAGAWGEETERLLVVAE